MNRNTADKIKLQRHPRDVRPVQLAYDGFLGWRGFRRQTLRLLCYSFGRAGNSRITRSSGHVMSSLAITESELKDRLLGCIFGCALGDAFGLPAEGVDPATIKERGGLTFPDKSAVRGFPLNDWSDDTDLGVRVMRTFTSYRRNGVILPRPTSQTGCSSGFRAGSPSWATRRGWGVGR